MSTNFSELGISEDLVQGIDSMGISTPTAIQAQAIPAILSGSDVLGIAQTGTGKTAAFVIPMLNHFLVKPRGKYAGIRGLILVPTRELANQISKVVAEIALQTHLRVLGLYGGVEQENQIKTLNEGVDVLVTTPGRMFDLISQGFVDVSKLEIFVWVVDFCLQCAVQLTLMTFHSLLKTPIFVKLCSTEILQNAMRNKN